MSGREECVCRCSDPSSHHASLRLLFLRFPHSSANRVATLSEGMVSWASCWASVERSQFRLHFRRSPLILLPPSLPLPSIFLFPLPPLCLSVCLSVFITLNPLPTATRALFCHFVILLAVASTLSCSLPLYPSISMLKYQQAWICHSRGPLILFCCFEESTWKTITDCPPRAASQTDYSLLNKHTLWLMKDGFL